MFLCFVVDGQRKKGKTNWGHFWGIFSYFIQHCFICRPSDSTVSEDAGTEPTRKGKLTFVASRLLPRWWQV
jgi:hypothetical protein